MLDSNIFDRLHDDSEAFAAFVAPARPFRVLVTHVQADQLLEAPEPEHSAFVALLEHTDRTISAGFVFDVSRLDHAAFGTDEDNAVIMAARGQATSENEIRKRAADGVIASTARANGAVLVTDDAGLAKRVNAWIDLVVWDWPRFRTRLLPPVNPQS